MPHTLERHQVVRRTLDETFAFHAEPRNLALITPPWLAFRVASEGALTMRRGLVIDYTIRPLLVPQRWTSEITLYDPPHRFVDEQRRGPYASWHHLHTFEVVPGGTRIADVVTYALPLGPLGRAAHALLVRRQLRAIFDYRERRIVELLGGM